MSKPDDESRSMKSRLVASDRVRVEFLIDDLIRQIGLQGISPVANCNGCNHCAAVAEQPGELKQ